MGARLGGGGSRGVRGTRGASGEGGGGAGQIGRGQRHGAERIELGAVAR